MAAGKRGPRRQCSAVPTHAERLHDWREEVQPIPRARRVCGDVTVAEANELLILLVSGLGLRGTVPMACDLLD
jgi:hypothetical protein